MLECLASLPGTRTPPRCSRIGIHADSTELVVRPQEAVTRAMVDASREQVSTMTAAGWSWPIRLAVPLLLVIAVGEGLVIWYDRAVTRGEYEQQALNARWEEEHRHARSVAAAFLRAVVEDDFSSTRPLLVRVASTAPRAAEAHGPEVALRDKVQAWFADRKLDRKRLKGYGFGGNHAGTSLREGRCIQVGALYFTDGSFVNYVLTLMRTDPVNGSNSPDAGCWRVDDLVLWAGERDGPRPW